jgi:hypothetical protein
MQILHTPVQPATLPPCWPLDPGERPASAPEAAAALLQLVADTSHDSSAMLAQLGAAPDLTDRARQLGLQLQELVAQAHRTALELVKSADQPRPLPTHPMTATDSGHLDEGWEFAGSVAVDSGQLLLIDPAYELPTPAGLEMAIKAADLPCAEVALSEHQLHSAVVCQSGIGDGVYPVFVRMAPSPLGGDAVSEIKVVFFEGNDRRGC